LSILTAAYVLIVSIFAIMLVVSSSFGNIVWGAIGAAVVLVVISVRILLSGRVDAVATATTSAALGQAIVMSTSCILFIEAAFFLGPLLGRHFPFWLYALPVLFSLSLYIAARRWSGRAGAGWQTTLPVVVSASALAIELFLGWPRLT